MDGQRFDELARSLATRTGRRPFVKSLAGALVGSFLVGLRAKGTDARVQSIGGPKCAPADAACGAGRACCGALTCAGGVCCPGPRVCTDPGTGAGLCCASGEQCTAAGCCPAARACGDTCLPEPCDEAACLECNPETDSCASTCASGETCSAGSCVAGCPANTVPCGASCCADCFGQRDPDTGAETPVCCPPQLVCAGATAAASDDQCCYEDEVCFAPNSPCCRSNQDGTCTVQSNCFGCCRTCGTDGSGNTICCDQTEQCVTDPATGAKTCEFLNTARLNRFRF